jgi:hypothetical protein
VDVERGPGSGSHRYSSSGRGKVVFDIRLVNTVQHSEHTVFGSLHVLETVEKSKTSRLLVLAIDAEENGVVGVEVRRGTDCS